MNKTNEGRRRKGRQEGRGERREGERGGKGREEERGERREGERGGKGREEEGRSRLKPVSPCPTVPRIVTLERHVLDRLLPVQLT